MLSYILTSFGNYFSIHWASILTWLIVIATLVVIRKYQVKWRRERESFALQRQSLITNIISKENLKDLKEKTDLLNELLESASEKLAQNNSNVDKEVLELVYKIASKKSQGRVSNVE